MKQEQLVNGSITTTLASSLTSGATTLSVVSSTGFPTDGNFRVRIDDEIILVTAVSSTTWTITRGGTATGHSSGAAVTFDIMAATLAGMQNDMYQVGTYANRPTTAKTGAIYVPSDAMVINRYNGSSWDTWGEFHKIIPPSSNFDAGYSWGNQGSATFTRQGLSWVFKMPAETSDQLRTLMKAVPTPPYTIEMGLRFLLGSENYVNMGFMFGDGTKFINLGFAYINTRGFGTFQGKFDSYSVFNSDYSVGGNIPGYAQLNYPEFFRFGDDGTNRFFQTSQNGRDWLLVPGSVVGRTDFLTPTHIGFGAGVSNNRDAYLEIFHYKEA